MRTPPKYRTFNELLDEVSLDFKLYSTEGMIEPANLIKVVQKVNYELGLKIHSTKHAIIEFRNKVVHLPADFHAFNYAYVTGSYEVRQETLGGTQSEDVLMPVPTGEETLTDDGTEKVYVNDCGDRYEVVQKKRYQPTRVYKDFSRIRIKGENLDGYDYYHTADIRNGFAYMSLDHGTVYICYEGILEDEEGNLLVLDNPLVNEYYEYALKERILENLYFNGEDVERKLGMIATKLRAARNNAFSFINTPDFSELKKIWQMNRKVQNHKYYNMFKS